MEFSSWVSVGLVSKESWDRILFESKFLLLHLKELLLLLLLLLVVVVVVVVAAAAAAAAVVVVVVVVFSLSNEFITQVQTLAKFRNFYVKAMFHTELVGTVRSASIPDFTWLTPIVQ
jgi:hypothetical protein